MGFSLIGRKDVVGQERQHEWLEEMLMVSTSVVPAELIEQVMADSRCPAFGPLHHYAVGAVLLACWRNAEVSSNRDELLHADLVEMAVRSSSVPGATCACWGICGAAVSAGMAYAIVRHNAPLVDEGWQEGQLLVSDLLARIARSGSPRCCKRDSRVAVSAAIPYFNALGGPRLLEWDQTPSCAVHKKNAVCMGSRCPYFPREK